MKYIVVLGDGMADESIESLGGRSPLEFADTPTLDYLSKRSEVGLLLTVPEGMKPGSDLANLSVLGYDPKKYYSGRSPLEALSIGVSMKDTDIAIRCNLVTVSTDDKPYGEKTILDHSADEISTEDAAILLDAIRDVMETEEFKFYVGTSYRHLLIWDKGVVAELTAPHDILDKQIGSYLPADTALKVMMEKSYDVLSKHPINLERIEKGLNPANSIWFWGAGTKPALSSFEEKFHKKGAMISAVDLLKGIAVGTDMDALEVEGANGGLHTNYEGKAQAAVDTLLKDGNDFVYIHVEAPDEMGHQGSVEKKVQAIEFLDQRVIKNVVMALEAAREEFRLLVLPDHWTPVRVRTHTSDPVPYLLYDNTNILDKEWDYNEKDAKASGIFRPVGHEMMEYFLQINK